MNLAGFDLPKVCKRKFLCLYKKGKVHSTRTSDPSRFTELGKHREQKLCILDGKRVQCKDYDIHRAQTLEEKLEDLESLFLNYWLTKFVQDIGFGHSVINKLVNSGWPVLCH